MKVNLLPAEHSNTLQVSFSFQGNSPTITEQEITSKLEGTFSQLRQLKKISSVSRINGGSIELQFDHSADIQVRRFELAAMIRQVYPQLPSQTSFPEISGSRQPGTRSPHSLLIYTINASEQPFKIRQTAASVFQKSLAGYPGIQDIIFSGTPDIRLAIRFDRQKCDAFQVSPEQISATLQDRFREDYPGMVEKPGGQQVFLRLNIGGADIEAIKEIVLLNSRQQEYRLKDIADVFLEETPAESYFRINGKNSVTMTIRNREGVNSVTLARDIKALLQTVTSQLPKGYEARLVYDDTQYLSAELHKNYKRLLLSLSILILFILLSYRNWKYLLTLLAGLLVNLSACILLVWATGIPVHLYTIAGLAVAFGIITDNAIVMLDYYHRFRGKKVFLALLGATCTTLAALSMIYLLPDDNRRNLMDFTSIIILALLASMCTVLWFIPGMYQLVFGTHQELPTTFRSPTTSFSRCKKGWRWQQRYYSFIHGVSKWRKTFVTGLLLLFGLPIFMLPEKWGNHTWYNKTIGSEWYQQKVKPVADKWLGGTLRLFVRSVYHRSGYRNMGRTTLFVQAELSYGNTPEQLNRILLDFEQFLAGEPGIDQFITTVSSGQLGIIEINFRKEAESKFLPYSLKAKLVSRSLNWTGVKWNIYGIGRNFNNQNEEDIPSFGILLKGYNYDELEKKAEELSGILLRHPRVEKVNSNERLDYSERLLQEYVLDPDPVKLKLYNVTTSEILAPLQQHGERLSQGSSVIINNQLYPVIIRSKDAYAYSKYELLEVPLQIDSVRAVKIRNLAGIRLRQAANIIHKEDRQYIRLVSFEYKGSYLFGNKFLEEVLDSFNKKLPVGFSAEKKDWRGTPMTDAEQYGLLLVLLLLNFLICSILFESLKQPLVILSALPVSFIGLFSIFYLGDYYFDQGGYAAFVMLGGLVVNAAIFVVNDINNMQKKRNESNKAIIRATVARARTILLTTVSSCCGFIPFLVGGENEVFWFSLALGTLGGLLFSLFAIFVLIPVLLWRKKTNATGL